MTANTLTFTDQLPQACDYCGGHMAADQANCPSCGARIGKPAHLAQVLAKPSIQHALTGLCVWFFIGAFGGYAYWSGQKVKAYARVALWLSMIGWLSMGVAARSNGGDGSHLFIVFPFFATMLLLMILWVFDLAHLLKTLKARF